jgi:UDP-glucuronate decarboxylase
MENTKDFTGPVNLGNPEEFSIRELAEQILRMVPGTTSQLAFAPLPADDPRQRQPDIGLARSVLDWEPQVPLELGLSKTIDYFQRLLARRRISDLPVHRRSR